MRVGRLLLAMVAVLVCASTAHAELQLKPFAGITFGGGTTLVDPEHAVGGVNFTNGVNANWLGNIFGFEADLGLGPGFFDQGSEILVVKSQVVTLTGNVIVAMPRQMAGYGLRPYFVGGAGMIHASFTTSQLNVFPLSNYFAAIDLGGGATGFFSDSFGVNWDLRHFQTVGATAPPGTASIAGEGVRLSFWRGVMALVYRY